MDPDDIYQDMRNNRVYRYDAFNRLSEVRDDFDQLLVAYAYDVDNRRTRKLFGSILGEGGYEGVDEDYYYTGWQVIAEMQDDQTTPTRQFVYGNYIDEPVCLDVNRDGGESATGAGDDRYFYHQNTLFSVYGLTDGEGALVEAYEYDPYGAHFLLTDGDDGDSVVNFSTNDARTSMGISREEGEEIANPYTFTGRRFDPETGWHYYRERYYDSERGRFVSRDYGVRLSVSSYSGALDAISAGNGDAFQGKMPGEARYDDGPNLYAYAKDSPCRYRDPMGRMSREAWNCACKASGKAEKELDRLREAAKQIDGFSYGSLNPFKEEMGCGWCAANLLSFLAVVKEHPPVCWDFNWFSGRKWLIPGGGVLPIPNMVLKHHFIALKPTIDEVSYTDPENEGRPVFDGWGGLWGNITWRCRFSEGTVGAYYREWGSAGLTWSVEPQY